MLSSYHVSGDVDHFNMAYSADGKRVQKTQSYDDDTSDYVTTYIYNGNNLVCEKTDDGETVSCKYYLYNSQGLVGFVQSGVTYTYRKNLFGDIIAIYQGNTKVAEYAYDAWGNCTVTNLTSSMIGTYNPFRYRGYYWDKDLNLYYLMSRYYDPVTGRFVNADSLEYLDPETIGGLNLYAYCGNNPVSRSDRTGCSWVNGLMIKLDNTIRTVGNWVSSVFSSIGQWLSNNVGGQINIGAEQGNPPQYYGVYTVEEGIGYSKSFDNGKPINFFINVPEHWWKIWEYQAGVDVNINGWGAGLALGTEVSLSFHCGNLGSVDLYTNLLGRLGVKHSTRDVEGIYKYTKWALNIPEIAVTVAGAYTLAYYASISIPAIIAGLKALLAGGQLIFSR